MKEERDQNVPGEIYEEVVRLLTEMRIQELVRVVLVTDGFDAAYDQLPEMFDMQFGEPHKTEVMGHTMKMAQGPGLEIYPSLNDEGPVADYLEKIGPWLYCIVWRVDYIMATKEHLASFDVDRSTSSRNRSTRCFTTRRTSSGCSPSSSSTPSPPGGVSGRIDRFDRSFPAIVVVDVVVEENLHRGELPLAVDVLVVFLVLFWTQTAEPSSTISGTSNYHVP